MTMIWEEFGRPALRRPLTREDVLIVAGLANARAQEQFSCEECGCFTPEYSSYEYGEYEPPSCCHREANGNLKTFPFRRAPARCFVLHFWASEFVWCFSDWAASDQGRESTHPLMHLWRMSGPCGEVRLNDRNKPRVAEALARFMAQKPEEDAAA